MHERIGILLLATGVALAAALPAAASAPGSSPVEVEDLLTDVKLVCSGDPATTCTDPRIDPDPDTGSPPFSIVDGIEGCPCVPDFIPGAVVRAQVTLIADDDASDNAGNGGIALGVLYEIRAGDELFAIAEIFTDPSGPQVGNWNPLFDESDLFSIDFRGGRVPVDALEPIEARLREIAQQVFGIDAACAVVPVLDDVVGDALRKNVVTAPTPTTCGAGTCGELEVDEQANPRASVVRFRLTLKFSNPPSPPPQCPDTSP